MQQQHNSHLTVSSTKYSRKLDGAQFLNAIMFFTVCLKIFFHAYLCSDLSTDLFLGLSQALLGQLCPPVTVSNE